MFDESYENYIRSILGYSTPPVPNFSYPSYGSDYTSFYRQTNNSKEIEECYPEIYKIIYPMVCKTCNSIQEPVTKELIEQLTNNIYFAIEGNDEVKININLTNEVRNNISNKSENRQEEKAKESKETRSPKPINRNLHDLIKILLLRELLNRPGNRPPVRPPRPPFPGGPGGRPPMRPPIMPREFEGNYDIYEI